MKSHPDSLSAKDIQGHSVTQSCVAWFKPFLLATLPQGTGKASFRTNAKNKLPPGGKGPGFSCK